jgi:hypothetical protein
MTVDDLAKIAELLKDEGRGNYEVEFSVAISPRERKDFPINGWETARNMTSGAFILRLV